MRVTQDKLHSLGREILSHPPYSPDISPPHYHLFLIPEQSYTQPKMFKPGGIGNKFETFFHF
jgi:hypothetical protein